MAETLEHDASLTGATINVRRIEEAVFADLLLGRSIARCGENSAGRTSAIVQELCN